MAAKGVLNALADHADDAGHSWPSIKRLALFAGCNEKTARKALQRLVDLEIVKRTQRPGKSDEFTIDFEWSQKRPLPKRTSPLPNLGPPPLPKTTYTPPKIGSRTVKEPPFEPSIEPSGNLHVQTNGHNGTALGLGLLPAEHLAGDGQDRCACDHAKDAWNVVAERCGWPRIQRFTPPRAKATEARLAEIGGLEGWNLMLGKMEASLFFRRRWQPSFDWILKPANLMKVMEGNYDERAGDTGLLATLAALGEPGT